MKKIVFVCLAACIFLSQVSDASARGRLFHTNEPDGTIEELNPDTGAVINSYPAPTSLDAGCSGLGFANNRLFFQNCGSSIYELNPATGAVINTIPNPSPENADALGFSGTELFVLDYFSAPLNVPAQNTGAAAAYAAAVTATPINAVAPGTAAIHVVDPNTGALIRTLAPGIPLVGGLTYAGGRKSLFVTDSDSVNGTVYELDAGTGAVLNSFVAPVSDIFGLGYSTARGTLFIGDTGGGGKTIFEVNPNTGEVINTLPVVPNWSLAADEGASTVVPTLNEWGMVVFTVLAGIASLRYLRRQQKEGMQ